MPIDVTRSGVDLLVAGALKYLLASAGSASSTAAATS